MIEWINIEDGNPFISRIYLVISGGEITLAWYDGAGGWDPAGNIEADYETAGISFIDRITFWWEGEIPDLPK